MSGIAQQRESAADDGWIAPWSSPDLETAMYKLIEYSALQPSEARLRKLRSMAANPETIDRVGPRLDAPEPLLQWINHLVLVADLIDAGCVFGLDDLTPEEWRGLKLWRSAQHRFGQRHVGCPGCGEAMKRSARWHDCGWATKTN